MNRYVFIAVVMATSVCRAELISSWSFEGDISNSVYASKLKAEECGQIDFAEGVRGQALKLSSAKKAALIVSNSDFLNALDAFSVSMWIKLDTNHKNIFSAFISKNGEENQGWQMRIYKDHGFANFVVRGADGSVRMCYAGRRVDDGNWHHVAGTYDGKYIYLYIDGHVVDITDVPEGGFGETETPLVIGAKIARGHTEPYKYMDGMIDELKIFNHTLSSEEVKGLANWSELVRARLTEIRTKRGVAANAVHRGAGKYLPENTIEAFEYAWKMKFIPEGDIRSTKDDEIVFFHDDDLKRAVPTAPKEMLDKIISDLTLAELKTLDVGAFRGQPGQKIPTIEEVFDALAKDSGRFIFLDYKKIDMKRLAKLVKKYGVDRQVVFTSKNYDLIQYWKELVPESPTKLWMGDTQEAIDKKLDMVRRNDYKDIYIIQLHYKRTGNTFQLSEDYIVSVREEFKKKGIIIQIMPWDIKDGPVFERLFKLGFEAVGTDYPDVVYPIYNKYFRQTD
ncbi:MAG: hypothetical protein JXD22_06225 [Sedimentisphaerales bacterium]|nr:hypothetical protein [Sedimentisphaerales bacterium]